MNHQLTHVPGVGMQVMIILLQTYSSRCYVLVASRVPHERGVHQGSNSNPPSCCSCCAALPS
jgi:hypothetical protein